MSEINCTIWSVQSNIIKTSAVLFSLLCNTTQLHFGGKHCTFTPLHLLDNVLVIFQNASYTRVRFKRHWFQQSEKCWILDLIFCQQYTVYTYVQKYILFTLTCTFDAEDHLSLENYTQYNQLVKYLLHKCDFCVLFYNAATNEDKMF